jgi:hypothetical protein
MKHIYDEQFFILESNEAKYKLSFHLDNDSEDPRYWDNPANMLCWHRDYSLGDKHNYSTINDALHDLCRQYNLDADTICAFQDGDKTPKERDKRIIEILKDYVYIRFLYLYDHSGITISLNDFKDPWDSGVVGIIYMDKQTTLKNFPNADDINWQVIAEENIQNEVDTYDQWIRGDVYSYCLEKLVKCPHCNHEEEEFVDSCGGFYGDDLTTNGMLDCLPEEIVTALMEVLNA